MAKYRIIERMTVIETREVEVPDEKLADPNFDLDEWLLEGDYDDVTVNSETEDGEVVFVGPVTKEEV